MQGLLVGLLVYHEQFAFHRHHSHSMVLTGFSRREFLNNVNRFALRGTPVYHQVA
jgi:hypothetical protein